MLYGGARACVCVCLRMNFILAKNFTSTFYGVHIGRCGAHVLKVCVDFVRSVDIVVVRYLALTTNQIYARFRVKNN